MFTLTINHRSRYLQVRTSILTILDYLGLIHTSTLQKHYIPKLIITPHSLNADACRYGCYIVNSTWDVLAVVQACQARQVLHKCIPCCAGPNSMDTIMSDFPSSRINYSRLFVDCGADYADPIVVKEGNDRTKWKIKSYYMRSLVWQQNSGI